MRLNDSRNPDLQRQGSVVRCSRSDEFGSGSDLLVSGPQEHSLLPNARPQFASFTVVSVVNQELLERGDMQDLAGIYTNAGHRSVHAALLLTPGTQAGGCERLDVQSSCALTRRLNRENLATFLQVANHPDRAPKLCLAGHFLAAGQSAVSGVTVGDPSFRVSIGTTSGWSRKCCTSLVKGSNEE